MHRNAGNHFVRRAWAMALLAGLLILVVGVGLAQETPAAPAAPSAATLTLGKTTTPAGGQDFWITAAGFNSAWGKRGKGPGQYRQPRDIDIDAAGNFYVSDHRNGRIQKVNANGQFIAQISRSGRGNGRLLRQNQIAIFGNTLYVADTDNHRVSVFNLNGTYLRKIGGTQGSGNGQFISPNGVAVDDAGNLYVGDTFNHRIQVFSPDGAYLRQWGTLGSADGQMRFPAFLDVAGSEVYVADSNNHRIQVFDLNGGFLRKFGSNGAGPGQFNLPVAVEVAADGYVHVSDTYNNRIQKFTPAGVYVGSWSQVAGGATLSRPNGVFVHQGLVYVGDIDSNKVQIFSQGTLQVDHGQQLPLILPAGTYDVIEAGKAGWTFGSATCNGGSPTAIANGVRVTLANGAAVNCTFTNSQ